jgi:trehalose 6-phosphate phosphatase
MTDLWRVWPNLKRGLAAKRGILLVLDFDGTLSDMVDHPRRAFLREETRRCLKRLSRMDGVTAAVLSGRSLADIRKRVRISGLYYGGNHGLELRGPGLTFVHPGARAVRSGLRDLIREARRELAGVPGARVEDKGLSASLHYRQVPPARRALFRRRLKALRGTFRNAPVSWRRGREVWEILPRVDWDKGRAAAYLRRLLGRPWPIAVGDDRTDEDMFTTFDGDGLTVRVGPAGRSSARFRLAGPEDVRKWLAELVEVLEKGRT